MRARTIGTSVNVGALGVVPLVAGVLARRTGRPLSLPYVVFVALGAVAVVGVAAAPETGTPSRHAKAPFAVAGVSIPVIGAGVALYEGASAPNTVPGFAVAVAAGVGVSGWALLARP